MERAHGDRGIEVEECLAEDNVRLTELKVIFFIACDA